MIQGAIYGWSLVLNELTNRCRMTARRRERAPVGPQCAMAYPILQLTPIVLNDDAGASSVRMRHYLTGAVLGTLPPVACR